LVARHTEEGGKGKKEKENLLPSISFSVEVLGKKWKGEADSASCRGKRGKEKGREKSPAHKGYVYYLPYASADHSEGKPSIHVSI